MIRPAQLRWIAQVLRRVLSAAVVMYAVFAGATLAQPIAASKKVLILFNNDAYTATQNMIDGALRSTLKSGSPVPVETYSEYVGNTRAGTGYEAEFVTLLHKKYEGKKFDAIFCVGQFPLETVLRNREELFGDTPVISISIDQRAVADSFPAPALTGVWGEIDFKANMALALSLHPAAKRVVMIEGVSETDKIWADRAKQDLREYESRLDFADLVGFTVPEMRDALAKLSPDTIVFFVSNIKDRAGDAYESPDYLRQVASASNAPIYGTTEAQLGNGLVGGELLNFEALGTAGAHVGLRVLAGEKPETIAPHAITSVPMFDARQLQRWGIREEALPAGSVVRFKQPGVWEEYRWYLIGLGAVIVAESLLIGALLFLRIRRRQAESANKALSSRIEEIVSNVPGIVWETRIDPAGQRRTTYISDYVKKMLGYTPDEWLQQPPGFGATIIANEDQDRVRAESEAVMETGDVGVSEFRWHTKDGRVRWVDNYLSPVFENGEVVGLRGVALDITDRKAAEVAAREAEEKDTALLSAIPDLMFLQTLDGVYLDYHARDRRQLLATPESFLGKNMRDVLPTALAERFAECFAKAREGEGPQILEYNIELEGAGRWFEARMVRSGDRILSIVRDMTDLKRTEQEAQELSGRLISAQEDERARLARDLHDDLSQNLALLSIELDMFRGRPAYDKGSVDAQLDKFSHRVTGIADDLRRLSQELHPAKLQQLGFVTAIRAFCREMQSAHDVRIDFESRDVSSALPDKVSLCLYRIVQESLQNVVKHSGARHARVNISANGNGLKLEVSDDGHGFDSAAPVGHAALGLVSMRERVRLVNGKLSVDSDVNGTMIAVTVPLDRAGSREDGLS